jgi:hypothetical protein
MTDRISLYRENDKIMFLETGEVFTVHEDLSFHMEPGIIVKEKIGRLLMHCEVRPAGHTRQRRDLAQWIVEPDAPPPPPENCLRMDDPGGLSGELHPDEEPVAVPATGNDS